MSDAMFLLLFFGLPIATLCALYWVVKSCVLKGEWYPIYGWAVFGWYLGFLPAIVALAKRNRKVAGRCAILAILSSLAWGYLPKAAFIGWKSNLRAITEAESDIRTNDAGAPLERLHRSLLYRQSPHDWRERLDKTWLSVQRDYYLKRIRLEAPGMPLSDTRRRLGYSRMWPSQREQLDEAWRSIQHGGKAKPPPGMRR